MNDTPPEIEEEVRERYMRMTGEERFLLGARMFESARAMVLASRDSDKPPDEDERHWLCRRFYGVELADKAYPKGPKL